MFRILSADIVPEIAPKNNRRANFFRHAARSKRHVICDVTTLFTGMVQGAAGLNDQAASR